MAQLPVFLQKTLCQGYPLALSVCAKSTDAAEVSQSGVGGLT